MSESAELEPWQQRALDSIKNYQGKGAIQITGRAHGKGWAYKAMKRLMDDIENRPVEDMILTEGRIHGARYYCVEPVGGSWLEMETWVTQTFGNPGEIWPKEDFNWPDSMRWAMNNRKFWFRNEKDRTMFILKWRS